MDAVRLLPTVLSVALASCGGKPPPPADRPVQPTGLWWAPSSSWGVVTGGNWNDRYEGGALWLLDVASAAAVVRQVAEGGLPPGCRRPEPDGGVVCDIAPHVVPSATRVLPTGAGIPGGRPLDPVGRRFRIYVPVRSPSAVTWVDVAPAPDLRAAEVACDEDEDGRCGASHVLDRTPGGSALPSDPVAVVVAPDAPFAFVPHLLDGALTLLEFDAAAGPFAADVETSFFREDPGGELELAGGFGVALRPCDPDKPPAASRDCTRPTGVATHRYWPGFRNFSVAPGLSVLQPGSDRPVLAFDPLLGEGRPVGGGAAYVPGTGGDRLVVVTTTPPGLVLVDTSLDPDGRPVDRVMATIPLCRNPNHVAVTPAGAGAPLAAVACYGDGEVVLVDLAAFTPAATVEVGAGANHLVHDGVHGLLWVASTQADSISAIGVDPQRGDYLTEVVRFSAVP